MFCIDIDALQIFLDKESKSYDLSNSLLSLFKNLITFFATLAFFNNACEDRCITVPYYFRRR